MIRVLIQTGQPVIGIGLCSVLNPDAGFEVASVCRDPETLIQTAPQVGPDIILIDFTSDLGFGLVPSLRKVAPDAKIVLLASAISPELGFQLMRVGVRAILRATIEPDSIVRSLRAVARGEHLFEHPAVPEGGEDRMIALSRRESQLADLVAQGLSNREIAQALSISEGTVRVSLSKLYRKVGAKDRYELALRGIQNMIPQQVAAAQPYERDRAGRKAQNQVVVLNKPAAEQPPLPEGRRGKGK